MSVLAARLVILNMRQAIFESFHLKRFLTYLLVTDRSCCTALISSGIQWCGLMKVLPQKVTICSNVKKKRSLKRFRHSPHHVCHSLFWAFSLTWPTTMRIERNKRTLLYKRRLQLPQVLFGTTTWPPFHCFGTPILPPRRHVKTLYTLSFFLLFLLYTLFIYLFCFKKQVYLVLDTYTNNLKCEISSF